MTEKFTAKTIEEAKALAAAKFGVSESEISFEIIDEGKKGGLLGFGKRDAVVNATYTKPEAQTVQPEAVNVVAEEVTAEPVQEEQYIVNEEAAAPVIEEEIKSAAEEKAAPEKTEAVSEGNDELDYSLDNYTLIEDEALINSKVKLARDYITSILRAMDIEVQFTVYQNENGAIVNIESSSNGTVIGRRGETLDAIQYLCSIIANKGDKDYFRITIDCLGYRKKRRETLEQLAAKVAKSVLRTGRSQPLEPMNPYERRVIHSAISAIEGVSSKSVGEEPYRKIIISSNNPKPNRRRDNRRDGGRRHDNRNRDNRRNDRGEITLERKSVNLSTSFEKDYKRPKPEDSIEGGLYGKIEL